MDAIGRSVAQLLKKDPRFLVKRNVAGSRVDTARENALEANAWGADRYVALHSNAGMKGTIVFHHSGSPKGEQLAKAIYRALAGLSPGAETGERVRAWDGLIEIHTPDAPAVLVELEAHDWKTGVQWLTTKRREIARAMYEGICRGMDLEPLAARPVVTGKVLQVPVPVRKPRWWPELEAYLRQVK
jgi:N-acetylmuramoyl-L-alanine amidase